MRLKAALILLASAVVLVPTGTFDPDYRDQAERTGLDACAAVDPLSPGDDSKTARDDSYVASDLDMRYPLTGFTSCTKQWESCVIIDGRSVRAATLSISTLRDPDYAQQRYDWRLGERRNDIGGTDFEMISAADPQAYSFRDEEGDTILLTHVDVWISALYFDMCEDSATGEWLARRQSDLDIDAAL